MFLPISWYIASFILWTKKLWEITFFLDDDDVTHFIIILIAFWDYCYYCRSALLHSYSKNVKPLCNHENDLHILLKQVNREIRRR